MPFERAPLSLFFGIFLATVGACSRGGGESTMPPPAGAEPSASEGFGIVGERDLGAGLFTSGHPSPASLARARDGGVGTVISLQAPTEDGYAEEEAAARELGLRFVSIPIRGAGDLTMENARAVDAAIDSAESGVLLHCGSGNRAGAMLALRAFYVEGKTPGEAIAFGREAGLRGFEGDVAARLEAACSAGTLPQCPGEDGAN